MTDARLRGNPIQQNLKVVQGLCGKNNLAAVVFGTTKSGKLTRDAFTRLEKQLSDVYWKDFKKQGATVFKLLPSHECAGQLVEKILDSNLLATNGIILVDNGEWIAPLSWNITHVRF